MLQGVSQIFPRAKTYGDAILVSTSAFGGIRIPCWWSTSRWLTSATRHRAGCIAVIDANGVKDAGFWGDILCARMAVRGVAGLVRDGAVVIPAALFDEIVALAVEQERLEGWIMDEVKGGAALPGLYPANAENLAKYEASKRS